MLIHVQFANGQVLITNDKVIELYLITENNKKITACGNIFRFFWYNQKQLFVEI